MNEESQVVRLSVKRWLVLFVVFLLTLIYKFCGIAYGPINDIVVAYFNVSYSEADWTVLISFVSTAVFLPIIAWFSFAEKLNLKLLLLTCSAALTLTCIFNVVPLFYPTFFGLIIIGQFLLGIVQSGHSCFPGAVATMWFPESHIGIVTGVVTAGWNLGMLLSELLLENVLKDPPSGNNETSIAVKNSSISNWFSYDQVALESMFLALCGFAIAIFVTVLATIPALPKHPPSAAQAAQRLQRHHQVATFKSFLLQIKGLFTDRTFILIQIVMGVSIQTFVLETLVIQELVQAILPKLNIQKSSVIIGGYILACRSVGDIIGSVIGGKVLDVYHKYRLQTILGSGLAFVMIVCFVLSYYFASFVGLCTTMFLFGVNSTIIYPPLYDAILQHTFPLNVILASALGASARMCITILISEMGRLLFHFTGCWGVLIFHCVLQLIGFLCSFLVNPKLKRSKMDQEFKNDEATIDETRPILDK